jgi:hypothetical protein
VTNYDRRTGRIELRINRTAGVFGAASTDGVLTVEAGVEKWLEVIGDLQREIDAIQLAEVRERVGGLNDELAAKIAEHGPAS